MIKPIIKLFWRLVSDNYLMNEFDTHITILNLHLYANDDDEAYVKGMLTEYIEPEIQRREL